MFLWDRLSEGWSRRVSAEIREVQTENKTWLYLELFSHQQVWQCLDSDEMMSKFVKVTQEIFTVINTTLFTKQRFFSLEVKCLTVQDLRGCILICLSTVEEIQMTTQSINPYCSYTCRTFGISAAFTDVPGDCGMHTVYVPTTGEKHWLRTVFYAMKTHVGFSIWW